MSTEMVICSTCGNAMSAAAKHCPVCGIANPRLVEHDAEGTEHSDSDASPDYDFSAMFAQTGAADPSPHASSHEAADDEPEFDLLALFAQTDEADDTSSTSQPAVPYIALEHIEQDSDLASLFASPEEDEQSSPTSSLVEHTEAQPAQEPALAALPPERERQPVEQAAVDSLPSDEAPTIPAPAVALHREEPDLLPEYDFSHLFASDQEDEQIESSSQQLAAEDAQYTPEHDLSFLFTQAETADEPVINSPSERDVLLATIESDPLTPIEAHSAVSKSPEPDELPDIASGDVYEAISESEQEGHSGTVPTTPVEGSTEPAEAAGMAQEYAVVEDNVAPLIAQEEPQEQDTPALFAEPEPPASDIEEAGDAMFDATPDVAEPAPPESQPVSETVYEQPATLDALHTLPEEDATLTHEVEEANPESDLPVFVAAELTEAEDRLEATPAIEPPVETAAETPETVDVLPEASAPLVAEQTEPLEQTAPSEEMDIHDTAAVHVSTPQLAAPSISEETVPIEPPEAPMLKAAEDSSDLPQPDVAEDAVAATEPLSAESASVVEATIEPVVDSQQEATSTPVDADYDRSPIQIDAPREYDTVVLSLSTEADEDALAQPQPLPGGSQDAEAASIETQAPAMAEIAPAQPELESSEVFAISAPVEEPAPQVEQNADTAYGAATAIGVEIVEQPEVIAQPDIPVFEHHEDLTAKDDLEAIALYAEAHEDAEPPTRDTYPQDDSDILKQDIAQPDIAESSQPDVEAVTKVEEPAPVTQTQEQTQEEVADIGEAAEVAIEAAHGTAMHDDTAYEQTSEVSVEPSAAETLSLAQEPDLPILQAEPETYDLPDTSSEHVTQDALQHTDIGDITPMEAQPSLVSISLDVPSAEETSLLESSVAAEETSPVEQTEPTIDAPDLSYEQSLSLHAESNAPQDYDLSALFADIHEEESQEDTAQAEAEEPTHAETPSDVQPAYEQPSVIASPTEHAKQDASDYDLASLFAQMEADDTPGEVISPTAPDVAPTPDPTYNPPVSIPSSSPAPNIAASLQPTLEQAPPVTPPSVQPLQAAPKSPGASASLDVLSTQFRPTRAIKLLPDDFLLADAPDAGAPPAPPLPPLEAAPTVPSVPTQPVPSQAIPTPTAAASELLPPPILTPIVVADNEPQFDTPFAVSQPPTQQVLASTQPQQISIEPVSATPAPQPTQPEEEDLTALFANIDIAEEQVETSPAYTPQTDISEPAIAESTGTLADPAVPVPALHATQSDEPDLADLFSDIEVEPTPESPLENEAVFDDPLHHAASGASHSPTIQTIPTEPEPDFPDPFNPPAQASSPVVTPTPSDVAWPEPGFNQPSEPARTGPVYSTAYQGATAPHPPVAWEQSVGLAPGASRPKPGTPEYEAMVQAALAQRKGGSVPTPASTQPATPAPMPVSPPAPAWDPNKPKPKPGTPEYEAMIQAAMAAMPSPAPVPQSPPISEPAFDSPYAAQLSSPSAAPAWDPSKPRPKPGTPEYEAMVQAALSQQRGSPPSGQPQVAQNQTGPLSQPPPALAPPPPSPPTWDPNKPKPTPGTPEYEDMVRAALRERLGQSGGNT